MNNLKEKIAVIGAGKIGKALGKLLIKAEYSVCFGSRSPKKLADFIKTLGQKASTKSIKDAILDADIVFLSIPYGAVDEFVPTLKDILSGKIVIDTCNPAALSDKGNIISSLKSDTAGEKMQSLLPKSKVIRAFTHIQDELLFSRATRQKGLWAAAIAGDDKYAKELTSKLIEDTGYVPVDVGSLSESSCLDPGGILFPNMFTKADMINLISK